MREEDFIPCDRAKKMKDLGFNEPCLRYFWSDQTMKRWMHHAVGARTFHKNSDPFTDLKVKTISQPSFEQAFRWFRENFNIQQAVKFTHAKYSYEVYFERLANGENPPVMVWHLIDSWAGLNIDLYNGYDEARLACLDKMLDIAEQLQKEQNGETPQTKNRT